jgi:hypothetical protein
LALVSQTLLHNYYKGFRLSLLFSLGSQAKRIDPISFKEGTGMEIDDIAKQSKEGVNWVTAIFMGIFHVLAIVALFFFTWKAFFVGVFLYWVSGSWGIGMGYHRLLTHRGYKTPKWVEYFRTF